MTRFALMGMVFFASGTLSARAAEGQKLFEANCAECHGEDGKGKTRMGEQLKLKIEFTDPKVQERLKDENIVKAIREGVTDEQTKKKRMKPIEDLTDEDVKTLVAFVRTFKK